MMGLVPAATFVGGHVDVYVGTATRGVWSACKHEMLYEMQNAAFTCGWWRFAEPPLVAESMAQTYRVRLVENYGERKRCHPLLKHKDPYTNKAMTTRIWGVVD